MRTYLEEIDTTGTPCKACSNTDTVIRKYTENGKTATIYRVCANNHTTELMGMNYLDALIDSRKSYGIFTIEDMKTMSKIQEELSYE